jgi:hypothetical protein
MASMTRGSQSFLLLPPLEDRNPGGGTALPPPEGVNCPGEKLDMPSSMIWRFPAPIVLVLSYSVRFQLGHLGCYANALNLSPSQLPELCER